MKIQESTYDDATRKAFLSSGMVIHQFHESSKCAGEKCPVHNPSDHDMRDCALTFNMDAFVFERLVPVGDGTMVEHIPDPDDYTLARQGGYLVYRNSAHCWKCDTTVTSYRKYDSATCLCGLLIVDGGHAQVRRSIGGTNDDWEERALVYEKGKFRRDLDFVPAEQSRNPLAG